MRTSLFFIAIATLLCCPMITIGQEGQQKTLEDLYAQIDLLEKQIELLRVKQEVLAIENATLREHRRLPQEFVPRQNQSYTAHRFSNAVLAEPPVVPVFVQQPLYSPVFAEPLFIDPFCPYGFGGGAFYGHPGWGIGFGGINFNFGHGHHWYGPGRFCGW